MGRIPDHLVRLALNLLEGKWVTIGAKADPKRPGKKKGGTPVELDGDGKITKGPAALTGKRPSELSQSHLFTGQPHKSQRKLFAEPGDPPPPPPIEETPPAAKQGPKQQPKEKAKKAQNMGLLAIVRREGGISSGDYEHADFREFGLLGALKKSGHSLDDMAATLARQGHISVPAGVSSPGDHLLQLLKKKTKSLLAYDQEEYDKEHEAYIRAREEALADGHQERELEEVRGRGEGAGSQEGQDSVLDEIFGWDGSGAGEASPEEPGDLAGDAAEPAGGVDTSFDFGPAAAPKIEDKPKAEPKKTPANKPKGATLQPDGTLKTKDGTVWVRAKAGGEHSPVTDKHYKGGRWMPVHGMSKPKAEKPAEEPVGTQSVEPGEGDKERAEDMGPQMREPRQPATPEQIAQKQKDQEHWDTVKQGPLGRIRGWMGDFPNKRGAEASLNSKAWQKFADELGPEKVKQIADEMERRRLERLGKIYDEGKANGQIKGDETKQEFLDSYKKIWANDNWGLGLRHVGKNPHSGRAAMHLYNQMAEPQTPESLRELNDYLANVQSGKDQPAAPPAVEPEPPAPPAPGVNLFGTPEPTKSQPATTQGLFGDQVPVEDPKVQPQTSVADDAAKGLDWLDQKQDKKTDGTGEMFGGLFSPGREQAGPSEPPKVEPSPVQKPKGTDDEARKHVDAALKTGDADEYWDENQDDPKFTKVFNHSRQQFLQAVDQAELDKSKEDNKPKEDNKTTALAPIVQPEQQQGKPENQEIPKPDYQSATGEEIANYMGQFNGWTSDGQAKYAKALQEMPKEAKDRFYAHKNEQAKKERAKKAAKTKADKKTTRQELQGVAPEQQPTAIAADQSQEVPPPPLLDTPVKGQSGYVNARASAVGNMGEDLPHSIRSRRGVDKNQNLATIDKAIETHGGADLGSKLTDPKMAMSVLAAHLALKALPKTMSPISKKYISGHHPYSLEQAQSDLNSVYDAAKQAAQQAIDQKQDALKTTTTIKNAVMDAAKKINNESPEGWRRWTNPVARHILDNTDKQLYFRNKNGPFYKSGKMFEEFLKNNVDGYDRSRPLAFYADQAASDKWADSVRQLVGGADAAKIGLRTKKKLAGFKASDAYLNNGYKRNSPHAEFTDHNKAAEFLRNQVGLRGKNFGNTMSDRERAEHLNKTAGAFQDLADVTGLPQRAVSMNGKLALGLGSHGHGGFDAHAASYFPSTKVMNLTRKAGMGSLAHEWAHALDHELGGGKTENHEAHYLTSQKSDTPLGKALSDLQKTYKDWENRMRNSEDWKYLNGRKKEYWKSPVEMFARAFEKYAQYKLAQSGRKNNYLSGVGNHEFWPSNEDMVKIAPAMEKVLELAKGKLAQQPAPESRTLSTLRQHLREAFRA